MGLRLSISEAQEKKLISEAQAKELRRLQKGKRTASPRLKSGDTSPSRQSKVTHLLVSPIEGQTPQQKLWRALVARYPDLVKPGILKWEAGGVVPGRRYSLDAAFYDLKLGCEVDGWEFHGKNIQNFKRDRQKDRLLLLAGWRVMRFFASEINEDVEGVVDFIEEARAVIAAEKQSHDSADPSCTCECAGIMSDNRPLK